MSKIKRLLSMSREEIQFRLMDKIYQGWEFTHHISKQDQLSDKRFFDLLSGISSYDTTEKELFDKFANRERDIFCPECYDREEKIKTIKKYFPYQTWISEADNMLSGNLTLLGERVNLMDDKWMHDPLTYVKWPQCFYANIKKHPEIRGCDIKYIWEFNRHRFLIVLGKAYWFTKEEKYAQRIFQIIQNWIAQNPYNSGVNWSSSLELAMRVISWVWAYFLCQGSKYITPKNHKIITKSIYQHGKHIENHLSFYSSPYNHLIGEAAALHLIGSLFPQIKNGSRWEKLGWNILEDQVEKQFHTDGMCVEQASFYHHFTLGFYLQSVILRKLNKKEVSEKVLSRLEKALEFSMYLTKPDGTLPMIGDIDNARSLYFNSIHSWDFRGFLGIGAVLYKRPDFKNQCNGFPEEVLWLFDDKEIDEFLKMESAPPKETSKAFFQSGYYISRDSWGKDSHYLCFDCGEISDGLHQGNIPSAAHGHADALSFELSAHGKSFIVDGGFYTYFGDLAWHKYFRLEEAHNTVKIGNYRQAEYCGRLTWQRVRQPELKKWISNGDYDFVSGSIDYDGAVRHERQIVYLKKQFWFFNDLVLLNDYSMEVESYLHFDPTVDLIVDKEERKIIACVDKVGILIKYFNNAKVTCAKGGNEPSEGWVAHGYGIKRPAWTVKFTWEPSDRKGIFPFLIIPWQQEFEPIQFGESKFNIDNTWMFESSFFIKNQHYLLQLEKRGKIQIFTDKTTYNI